MKKQKSELLEAETLLSLCLSNLCSYETFWNLICWCLSDPQNYSCANVDTQQRLNHWLRKMYVAYQKLQDSNHTLATPAFLFSSFFFNCLWLVGRWYCESGYTYLKEQNVFFSSYEPESMSRTKLVLFWGLPFCSWIFCVLMFLICLLVLCWQF